MSLNLKAVSKKWQKVWKDSHVFEANADPSKKKFFTTFPYPYMNGYLHVGHTYTSMRCEALARFKRMQGYNVLFPQGWHATGSPIDSAAKRVAEGEQKQIELLKQMGFSLEEIKEFSKPEHWVKTFSKAAQKDLSGFGLSVDWRRSFVTTNLNPRYSKFIQWQFRKLKEKGLVVKGEHPVVWCPKENCPVGDHSRLEGEGEAPEQMVVLKFHCSNKVLPAATFRPETVFGVTNLWVNPAVSYVEAEVDGEVWIVAEPAIEKLKDQKHIVTVKGGCSGESLIGKTCKNPATGALVPILPASFVTPNTGTGIVMSVPSHAPYDWIALQELQKHPPEEFKELLLEIKPISLISVASYGEHPAQDACKKFNILKQHDPKLEEATGELYKKEYHTGILKQVTGKYEGKTVQNAKQELTFEFTKERKAVMLFDIVNPVVCRCLARCHVRIVDDQWFLKYGDSAWKKTTSQALAQCKLYPEKTRQQFENVIEWLKDWACTREFGLGTNLPWDEKWVIESLSDSTLYNCYYTITHILENISISKVNDALFDYIFLAGDIVNVKADHALANDMRREFEYWYPVDFRNSGKDLVQNHLTFYLFNHCAIFSEKYWPKGIGVNGYVSIENVKMSKSKGNVRFLRDLIKEFTPDVTRLAILGSGEELSDVNWDSDFARTMQNKLLQWSDFAVHNYSTLSNGDEEQYEIDTWFESQLHACIRDTTTAMEETLYRTALMRGFFDLQRNLKWYTKRRTGTFNKTLMQQVIEVQTKMLTPFAPHVCEELWAMLQKKDFISNATWPIAELEKITATADANEQMISNIADDLQRVLQLANIKAPAKITLFVAEEWKHALAKRTKEAMQKTRDIGQLMKEILPSMKEHSTEAASILQKYVKDAGRIPQVTRSAEGELKILHDSKKFFTTEFSCAIEIVAAATSQELKARQALPGKPAILIT